MIFHVDPEDFFPTVTQISISGPDSPTPVTIPILIQPDLVVENLEMFTAILNATLERGVVIDPNRASVNIFDSTGTYNRSMYIKTVTQVCYT